MWVGLGPRSRSLALGGTAGRPGAAPKLPARANQAQGSAPAPMVRRRHRWRRPKREEGKAALGHAGLTHETAKRRKDWGGKAEPNPGAESEGRRQRRPDGGGQWERKTKRWGKRVGNDGEEENPPRNHNQSEKGQRRAELKRLKVGGGGGGEETWRPGSINGGIRE